MVFQRVHQGHDLAGGFRFELDLVVGDHRQFADLQRHFLFVEDLFDGLKVSRIAGYFEDIVDFLQIVGTRFKDEFEQSFFVGVGDVDGNEAFVLKQVCDAISGT